MRFNPISLLLTISGVSAFTHHAGLNSLGSRHGSSAAPCFRLKVFSVQEDNAERTSAEKVIIPDMKAYAAGYCTVFTELPYEHTPPSSGQIPSDLIGTYFRCGPAMFSAGSIVPPKTSIVQPKQPPSPDGADKGRMVKHPFDADGAVLGVTFSGDGRATARFRYVRTAAMTNERKKGKKLYTGMETTRMEGAKVGNGQGNDFPVPMFKYHLQPGLNKNRKNTSNTRSVYWSKKLITLWEGGLPYKLDALGLSTEGRSQLGGVLNENDAFSGKAVFDSLKDRMLFYSNKQDGKSSELTIYEFNSKFRVAGATEYKLLGFALISDFAITEKFALFVQPSVSMSGMSFMVPKEPAKALKMDNGPSMLHILKRGENDSKKTIPIPQDEISDADLHFVNAFENDGLIIFDAIRSDSAMVSKTITEWPWAQTLDDFASTATRKSLWRYKVDVTTESISKECITNIPTYFGTINPAVSGQKHQFVYAAVGATGNSNAPPQGIGKFDIDGNAKDLWYPNEYEFCGEPMFAPKKSDAPTGKEDDGYIISILFNGKDKKSEVLVFDATNIAAGPIARITLGIAIPHGLYGCFSAAEECNWSAEEIERRAKLADKMESRGNMWNEVKSDFSGLGLRLDDFEEYFGDIL